MRVIKRIVLLALCINIICLSGCVQTLIQEYCDTPEEAVKALNSHGLYAYDIYTPSQVIDKIDLKHYCFYIYVAQENIIIATLYRKVKNNKTKYACLATEVYTFDKIDNKINLELMEYHFPKADIYYELNYATANIEEHPDLLSKEFTVSLGGKEYNLIFTCLEVIRKD